MQMNLCSICNRHFTLQDGFTIDHIVPKSKGGTNDINNLHLVHAQCNNAKDSKSMKDFYDEILGKSESS